MPPPSRSTKIKQANRSFSQLELSQNPAEHDYAGLEIRPLFVLNVARGH